MIRISLSQEEIGLLQEYIHAPVELIRFKAMTVLARDRGIPLASLMVVFHRDERVIAKRIKDIRTEIAPYLRDPSWEVFVADETGFMLEALTRKAWLRRGEKTIIRTERSKERQNYLGFFNLKTGKCRIYPITRGRQKYIFSATRKHISLFPGKRICIVWDNGKFHKGKFIQEALKKDHPLERVHLISFPLYAPDTNPIEHVWREGKHQTANRQFKTFEDTKRTFEQAIKRRIFNYKI